MNTKGRIVAFIATHQAEHGWAPTIEEIGVGVGLRSKSTVHKHLRQLHDRGELVLGGGPRMIRLTTGRIAIRHEPLLRPVSQDRPRVHR